MPGAEPHLRQLPLHAALPVGMTGGILALIGLICAAGTDEIIGGSGSYR